MDAGERKHGEVPRTSGNCGGSSPLPLVVTSGFTEVLYLLLERYLFHKERQKPRGSSYKAQKGFADSAKALTRKMWKAFVYGLYVSVILWCLYVKTSWCQFNCPGERSILLQTLEKLIC